MSKKVLRKINRNKTQKKYNISGKILFKENGWIVAEINGNAYNRGFAHGVLFYKEIKKIKKVLKFLVKKQLNVSWSDFIKKSNSLLKPIIKKKFTEYYEEMQGIVSGANRKGSLIELDVIIAWNGFLSLWSYYLDEKNSLERCSAFIATGESTRTGGIVMAHNTHADFMISQFFNLIMYVKPSTGISFTMQTAPGLIFSSTDWFICDNGIMGCETTISKINYTPKFGSPIFCRIRQAMQYANTLDEYTKILLDDNAGDYACSWLLGDTRTNEIMLFELGLKIHNIERKKSGVFYGMNSPISNEIKVNETTLDKLDVSSSMGNRNKRLTYLLNNKYKNKIDVENSKKIISDHYDYYLDKEIMNSRTICKHSEVDSLSNYDLFGAMDGKIVTSEMVKNKEFLGIFGSSCGKRNFNKSFFNKHPKLLEYKDYVINYPSEKWTLIKLI